MDMRETRKRVEAIITKLDKVRDEAANLNGALKEDHKPELKQLLIGIFQQTQHFRFVLTELLNDRKY